MTLFHLPTVWKRIISIALVNGGVKGFELLMVWKQFLRVIAIYPCSQTINVAGMNSYYYTSQDFEREFTGNNKHFDETG